VISWLVFRRHNLAFDSLLTKNALARNALRDRLTKAQYFSWGLHDSGTLATYSHGKTWVSLAWNDELFANGNKTKSSGLSLGDRANSKDGAGSRDQPNKCGLSAWVEENRNKKWVVKTWGFRIDRFG
jgi:hypothetical protein